jgi:nucleoside-diphosphate kinase
MSYKTKSHEQTLVLIKPDAVQRGLIGEVISRFEKKGLKIVAMKMITPTEDLARRHYDQPESAMMALGNKTLATYAEKGLKHKFSDPMDIARDIQKKLVRFMMSGPIVAMVIEGAHAVAHVRKIRGQTNPLNADVGTITADLTIDSYFIADEDERALRNLVHASGTVEEAEVEKKIWFTEDEIQDYDLAIERVLYDIEWEGPKGKGKK